MAASITLLIGIATLVGTYEDPFTKKKKIVLVSDQFEKNLDRLLRQIMQSQLNGQFN
jgi:nicotinamide mononucleotide adenylyltransferase